jgi:hypothetical protein
MARHDYLAFGDIEGKTIADRQRDIAVGNLLAQAREDELAAQYRRRIGEDALFGGFLTGGAKFAGGLASLLEKQAKG